MNGIRGITHRRESEKGILRNRRISPSEIIEHGEPLESIYLVSA